MHKRLAGLAVTATAVMMAFTGPSAQAEPMKIWGCAPTAPGEVTTHNPMQPWNNCPEHGPVKPQTVDTDGVPIDQVVGR